MKPKDPDIEDRMRWNSEDNSEDEGRAPESASQPTNEEPEPDHQPTLGEALAEYFKGH